MSSETAGQADPYWYEWFVGLIEVVDLLDPAAGIQAVAFQVPGPKGWDDVVVQLKNGCRRCYQVKHTREQDRLTFGDLVTRDADNSSLLGYLFDAWLTGNLDDGRTECILYTNREAGRVQYTLQGRHLRPALTHFYPWLANVLTSVGALAEIVPKSGWEDAWSEWLSALDRPGATDNERLRFLRALKIRTRQDDLEGLVERTRAKLAHAFGVNQSRVEPLLDALHRALRRWTTGSLPVTVEDLCSELALPPEPSELAPAPPPPSRFFPSREPLVRELEELLFADGTPPIIFLGAEPGAGKTSVVSRITNRRSDQALSGLVGLRYFCFEPIRPELPVISPDTGRVRPKSLWFSLITQLREGLRGRLHELNVPVRNALLEWQEARAHVLRVAHTLAGELRHPFVIVIDGIDHAARAAQSDPETAAQFFSSLPGPDTLVGTSVRLLIAGQPPEQYQQYPSWLRGQHPNVLKVGIEALKTEDVRDLYVGSNSMLSAENTDAAVRLIEQNARGNTLATVFSVAESESAASLEEFATRLNERRLRDGLESYYLSIWQHGLQNAGELVAAVEPCLIGAIVFARQDVKPEFLASAFSDLERPPSWWRSILVGLGPILIESSEGFRVRHNDVRVFLAGRFGGYFENERRHVASNLVDHYLSDEADRLAVHRSLFSLFKLAGRTSKAARHFTTEWVYEAAAFGTDLEQLTDEFTMALHELAGLREWSPVLRLACAAQTLDRLREISESGTGLPTVPQELPPFLPSEASVRPISTWTVQDLSQLLADANRLTKAGLLQRARALLDRWFGGMDVCDLVGAVKGTLAQNDTSDPYLAKEVDELFVKLGRLIGDLGWAFSNGVPGNRAEHQAAFAVERGYLHAICSRENIQTLGDCFSTYVPSYLRTYELAVENFAEQKRWQLVCPLLGELSGNLANLSESFRSKAVWWALCSGASKEHPEWLSVLDKQGYGMSGDSGAPLDAYLAIARARGWLEVASEPSYIADGLYPAFDPLDRHKRTAHLIRLLFRTAALIGRVTGVARRSGLSAASEVVTVEQVMRLISALWGIDWGREPVFENRWLCASLAFELAELSFQLGPRFIQAVTEAALPHARQFPIDQRRAGLWFVVAKVGQTQLLREWLENWLGTTGRVWKVAARDRAEIVLELLPLAKGLGEQALVNEAIARLRRTQIGYEGEERGFFFPIRWLDQLIRRNPSAWTEEGWRLLYLSATCDNQGCSEAYGTQLEEIVVGGAIRCGPSELWQFFASTLADSSDEKWHYTMRNSLSGGFIRALAFGEAMPLNDRITIWCLVLAFCRWFDPGDIQALAKLRDALLSSCSDEPERIRLSQELHKLTPSEVEREPAESRGFNRTPPSFDAPAETILEPAFAAVYEAKRVLPTDAALIIRHLVLTSAPDRQSKIRELLISLGSSTYSWTYDDFFTDDALVAIIQSISEDDVWMLVSAIELNLPSSSYWIRVVAEKLHWICLSRARSRDITALRDGLNLQLEVLAQWAFGGVEFRPSWPALPLPQNIRNWEDLSLQVLPTLFVSRSAEVIASAVTAVHVLVTLRPELIVPLFERLDDQWSRWWLLNAAEPWAALHPDMLERVGPLLEHLMRTADFASRLQAWIVLCRLADVKQVRRPTFPVCAEPTQGSILTNRHGGILDTGASRRGHANFVDRHTSARGKLDNLRHLGFDLSGVEADISEALLETGTEVGALEILNSVPHRYNDCVSSDLSVEQVVGNALERRLTGHSDEELILIAQGFLDNEDGWVLRETPQPSPRPGEWPGDNELGGIGETRLDDPEIIERCRNLALAHVVPHGWTVVAATLYLASWKEDFSFYLWLEAQAKDGLLIAPPRRPTMPSGRTFLQWLGDYHEPAPQGGSPVLTFFTGGGYRLAHSSLEIQPAKLWRQFGWRPETPNPLKWQKNSRTVAFYQRLHGPPYRLSHGPHHRQPVLNRWFVKQEALDEVNDLYGLFRQREIFESDSVDYER